MRPGRALTRLTEWALIALEAGRSFLRSGGLTAASSLSFYTILSLIPALFLLSYIRIHSEWLSGALMEQASSMMGSLIPELPSALLEAGGLVPEQLPVSYLLWAINIMALLWSVSPLISELRSAFGVVFRVPQAKRFYVSKLMDVVIGALALMGFAFMAVAGIFLSKGLGLTVPRPVILILTGALIAGATFTVYHIFGSRGRKRHLFAASVIVAVVWLTMRPLFSLFLEYNTGFGFAFGSLKSLYVAVIWIYISQCLLIFGAEVAAWAGRRDAIIVKRLMEGWRIEKLTAMRGMLLEYADGEALCKEGEPSGGMFYIISGRVAIARAGAVVAHVDEGNFVGEISFLLGEPRSADVIASGEVKAIQVSHATFSILAREFPEVFEKMLREMAARLKRTTSLLG